MRTAFINQFIAEAHQNESLFLIVGDLGYSVVEPFRELFPKRFLNAGIAEQNMAGLAAGLALEGYNVFIYSIGNFPTLRCMEQIRYDIAYHRVNVKITAVGAGYAYGALGASHHTTEDIGMLRVIPDMLICSPGDPAETRQITTLLCRHDGPGYLRLGKAGEPIVHGSNLDFPIGKMLCIREGTGTALLSTGSMLKYASDTVDNKYPSWGLFSVPFIKPLDLMTLSGIAKKYSRIITIEEHQRSAGFGSAILEGLHDLVEQNIIPGVPDVKRIAIPDTFLSIAGSQEYLKTVAGLLIP